MNIIRTVTVKKGNTMKVKKMSEDRSQMIEDGKKKEDLMYEKRQHLNDSKP